MPLDAPPMFLAVATRPHDRRADRGPRRSGLYEAWRHAGRPVEFHAYAAGGHGFGMNRQGLPIDSWPGRFAEWLAQQRLVPG